MPEAGKLFVIDGDLTKVDCDAVLVPTDSELRVERPWAHLLGVAIGKLTHHASFPAGSRVQKYTPPPGNQPAEGPVIWLGDIGSDAPDVDWYADGLTEFVRKASASLRRGRRRRPPRIAVNVVGTDWVGVAMTKALPTTRSSRPLKPPGVVIKPGALHPVLASIVTHQGGMADCVP